MSDSRSVSRLELLRDAFRAAGRTEAAEAMQRVIVRLESAPVVPVTLAQGVEKKPVSRARTRINGKAATLRQLYS